MLEKVLFQVCELFIKQAFRLFVQIEVDPPFYMWKFAKNEAQTLGAQSQMLSSYVSHLAQLYRACSKQQMAGLCIIRLYVFNIGGYFNYF